MRLEFDYKNKADVSEVLKYNTGIKPRYGKGTMKGCAWCYCNKCVGNMALLKYNKIIGWFEPVCERCGLKIDYSEADKYV